MRRDVRNPLFPTPVSSWALLCGAAIFLFGALIHWVAPMLGPDWYAFLEAPRAVVRSARSGTALAWASTSIIGALMFGCAVCGFAARDQARQLPMLRGLVLASAVICLLRGVILIPLVLAYPGRFKTEAFDIVASVVWFMAGVTYLIGFLGLIARADHEPGSGGRSGMLPGATRQAG